MRNKVMFLIIMIQIMLLSSNGFCATYGEIVTEMRKWIYETDTTNTNYSNDMLSRCVEQAQDILLSVLPASCFPTAVGQQNVQLSAGEYALPSNWRSVITVRVGNSVATQLKLHEVGTKSYNPQLGQYYWYVLDNKLFLPGLTTQTVQVTYIKHPTLYTSSSTVLDIADAYRELLVTASLYVLYMRTNQPQKATVMSTQVEQHIKAITTQTFSTTIIETVNTNTGFKQLK